jgi:hypothetical protein
VPLDPPAYIGFSPQADSSKTSASANSRIMPPD